MLFLLLIISGAHALNAYDFKANGVDFVPNELNRGYTANDSYGRMTLLTAKSKEEIDVMIHDKLEKLPDAELWLVNLSTGEPTYFETKAV